MQENRDLSFDGEASRPTEPEGTSPQSLVAVTALRLALAYADETAVPLRYRGDSGSAKERKPTRKETLIEQGFQNDVSSWRQLLEEMFSRIDEAQAWRFISCSPDVSPGISSVTKCQDFNSFIDYLVQRRDIDKCDYQELGCLCSLLGSFQQAIVSDLVTKAM